MTSLVALSVSIGVLGAIATWLALGVLPDYLQIWVIFMGWATYFANGGDTAGLKTTIVSGIWGAICAWVAFLILGAVSIDLGPAIWPAIVVGVTVLILCLGAHVEALKNIPAGVYGYAATAGIGLLMTGASATAADFSNPLILAAVSIVVGAVFGLLSSKLAGIIGK